MPCDAVTLLRMSPVTVVDVNNSFLLGVDDCSLQHHNRVVHSWPFSSIFHPFLTSFLLSFSLHFT